MDFALDIFKLIGDALRVLYYIIKFLFELFDYSVEAIATLPSEVSGTVISVMIVGIFLIIYKAIKL